MDATPQALQLDDDDPWPGLAAYDEASKRFFHGRDDDSAELLRLVRVSPFVTLYGKSGLGKSSMLQAGVFPSLRQARFLPVYLRLNYSADAEQPLMVQAAERLRQEIEAAGADGAPFAPDESLWEYLQRLERPIWTADNFPLTPVLVFDQFEEVFSRGGSPEQIRQVLDTMADLVADRLPSRLAQDREAARRLNLRSQQYRVVLSFRSDFLADIESWEKQANLPRHEALHLTALSRDRAIEAVERAGAKVLEPGVAVQIVDFLLQREGSSTSGRGEEVEPVLLSLCCYQLNRRRARPGRIDAALLRTVGEGILKGFYEDALKGAPARVSTFIEEYLILGDRYRNSYPLDEALASGALTRDELDGLTASRLLRVDPQGQVPRIELIHDRLVPIVREARDMRRAGEAQVREREAVEERMRQDRERERLAESERERRRVARWRNGLAAAVAMLFVATGWAIYFGLGKAAASDEAQHRAEEASRLADEAAQARTTALQDLKKTQDELAEIRRLLKVQEQATAELVPGAGSTPTEQRAAAAKASQATEAVLQKVEAAEQRITDVKASGAYGPAPAASIARPVPPTANPASASAGNPGTLEVDDWRLSSGGCLKGEVSVVGRASFRIVPEGDNVIVSSTYEGSGDGFKVLAGGQQTLPRKAGGAYEIDALGKWNGPGGRQFTTSAVVRIQTADGLRPTAAALTRIRTNCGKF